MPLITAADVDFALKDFSGSPSPNVVLGAESCYGDLKREPIVEATAGGMQRIGTHITLVLRDGALSSLIDEATIVVDGESFSIRDVGTVLHDGTRILTLVES